MISRNGCSTPALTHGNRATAHTGHLVVYKHSFIRVLSLPPKVNN